MAAGIAVVGIGSSLIWQVALKHPLAPEFDSVARVWRDVMLTVTTLRDAVGLGGWLNTRMDPLIETIWVLAWVLLCATLVRSVPVVVRWVLLGQVLVLLVVSVLLIGSLRAGGFGTQGRFLLPFVVVSAIVLATYSPMASQRGGGRSSAGAIGIAVFIAVGHGSALLIAAHRQARGLNDSPIDFGRAVWSPPGGWIPAAVLAAVSCACIVATGAAGSNHSEAESPTVLD
jgi:hypothetical protein